MATPPGAGGEVPQAGYYPDPSIPGYIRFWNGGAWVPGTSRPAPKDGDAPPAAPVSVAPQVAPSPAPAPRLPEVPAVPAVEETGPVFLDDEPEPAAAAPQEPASAWQATTSLQTGFGGERDQKVSWGVQDEPRSAATPATPAPASAVPSADPRAAAAWPAAGAKADHPGGSGGVSMRRDPATAAAPVEDAAPAPAPAPAWPEPAAADPQPVVPEQRPAAPAPAPTPAPVAPAARLGGMPVTPAPTAAPTPAPGPAPAPATWSPQPAHPAVPTPTPTPMPTPPAPTPVPGPAAQDPQQPVAPWKPPVEDVFTAAAREQAAARPAGLGRRLLARLVDGAVLGALVGAASYPFVTAAIEHIDEKIEAARQSGVTVQVWLVDGTTSVQFGIVLAAFLVLGTLYEVLPTAKWGRTLGKKLCGIEVRDIEGHQPPTFGAALRRWLVYGVLGLLGIGLLNVVWCVFDRPWRQCWHDKAAGTFVAR
ncbi:RDD family protein [Streptomyces sp. NPDC048623]|uniref:RDD family protein n=1 Tax=Streptomyces sp. NPDC048623 TaxID=3155761 RepID=UPI00343D6F8E